MAIIYGLKVNLSVAMVAMLNHSALAEASAHGHANIVHNETKPADENCAPAGGSNEAPEVSLAFMYFLSPSPIANENILKAFCLQY